MVTDSPQNILQPDKRINTVEFAGSQERIKHPAAPGGFMTAGK